MTVIHLSGDISELQEGLEILKNDLNFEISSGSEGINIDVEKNTSLNDLLIKSDGKTGQIIYTSANNFYRQLSRWLAHFNAYGTFEEKEKAYFQKTGTMIDASRNAVLNLDGAKELLRHMATMGMNQAMLYTEDTYEVEDYPYFGYLRGRYTKDELKELDDYAAALGIEMIPCIQTLGHLYQVLQYGTHSAIQDTSDVVLVGEEKTYDFLEKIIKAASAPFRSNRIHIGMDEAFGVGTGRYKQIHGERDTFAIMNEHVQKVVAITDKLGLDAMMWSDMYFRAGSKTGDYYDLDAQVPEEIIKEIPNVDMVFWDYYHEDEDAYSQYLKKHIEMKQKVIFAGGVWTWNGIAPNYGKSIESTKAALAACRKTGIDEVFATMWGDDGGETPIISALPGLKVFADLSYNDDINEKNRAIEFKYTTGIDYDDFYLLNALDETPGVTENNLSTSAGSKVLLWQDPFLGRFDKVIEELDLNSYYHELSSQLANLSSQGTFTELFDFYYKLSKVLSKRASFGVQVKQAYDNRDRDALKNLKETAEELTDELEELRLAHQKVWMLYNKPFGWEVLDVRHGGAVARMKSAASRLESYLNGDLDSIPELEEEKLMWHSGKGTIGRGLYTDMVSTSKLSGV